MVSVQDLLLVCVFESVLILMFVIIAIQIWLVCQALPPKA